MDSPKKPEPIEVRAPRGARMLEIDWADGHRSIYPHDMLRGYCPCAMCQGHEGPIRYVAGGDQELADLGEVGDYALRMTWGDGHATGIYSFTFLRELCCCPQCATDDQHNRRFSRG